MAWDHLQTEDVPARMQTTKVKVDLIFVTSNDAIIPSTLIKLQFTSVTWQYSVFKKGGLLYSLFLLLLIMSYSICHRSLLCSKTAEDYAIRKSWRVFSRIVQILEAFYVKLFKILKCFFTNFSWTWLHAAEAEELKFGWMPKSETK